MNLRKKKHIQNCLVQLCVCFTFILFYFFYNSMNLVCCHLLFVPPKWTKRKEIQRKSRWMECFNHYNDRRMYKNSEFYSFLLFIRFNFLLNRHFAFQTQTKKYYTKSKYFRFIENHMETNSLRHSFKNAVLNRNYDLFNFHHW